MISQYEQQVQRFQALLTSAREREQRCGALVARALQDPPPDPDDDTLDADDSIPPSAPPAQETPHAR